MHGTTTLVLAQQREPVSLNPALDNGAAAEEWGELFYQYLLKYDDRGRLVGDAATQAPSLENGGISRDGLTITYHLRKRLRFSDGTPLTARDCVWSIEAIQNPANDVQSRYGYDRIVKAEAPNDTTLIVHLAHPFSPLLSLIFTPQGFPIFPAHLLARYPNFNSIPYDARPVASGPYVVTHWVRGDRIEMRANPYYWQGKPAIERLVIRFVPDPNAAIDLLRTHEIDGFADDQDPSTYPILQSVPGTYVSNERVDGVGTIVFNTGDPLVADPRVRHALAEALDLRSMVAKVYRGSLSYAGAGRGLFMWAYDRRAYPDIPYDPRDARRLLDVAGWRVGTDGIRHKDGRPLHVDLILRAAQPSDAEVGAIVASEERAIGARVSLRQYSLQQFVAPAELGGPVYGGKFQMALYPFTNGDDPDTTDQFACRHVPPNGYNKSHFCDPAADALMLAGRRTYRMAARKRIYVRLEALLYRELPVVLLYQGRQISAFTKRLRGQTTSLAGPFWNVARWSLTESHPR